MVALAPEGLRVLPCAGSSDAYAKHWNQKHHNWIIELSGRKVNSADHHMVDLLCFLFSYLRCDLLEQTTVVSTTRYSIQSYSSQML